MDRTPDRPSHHLPTDAFSLVHITTDPYALWHLFRGQIAFMKQRGVRIHAVASPGAYLGRFAEREQVPVSAVEMPRRITPLRDLAALYRLVRLLRRLRPRIVHAHTPKGGLLGALAARLAGVPVRIYHCRGLPLLGATGLRRRLLCWTERLAGLFAHRVLCVSHSIRDIAVRQRLFPARKVRVLARGSGNGVDGCGRFDPDGLDNRMRRGIRERCGVPDGAVVAGFVGRLVRDKGIGELLEAWEMLRGEIPGLHLLLVGPFEPQDPVGAQAAVRLESDERIHLTGDVPDAAEYYAAMDLVVLPTYREGFPNVALEAAAMRLPIVATRVPGCTDAVVDGETGTLAPARDAVALAAAIRRYAEDPDLRARHGAAARARVLRDFRPEQIWEALYREYASLLRARR